MSLSPYSYESINEIIVLYKNTFPELPSDTLPLYESHDAMMWEGYIVPVLLLNEKFDSLFRYSQHKSPIKIVSTFESVGIESLSIEEIAYLVKEILVNEKNNLGFFASMIVANVIGRIILRMEELSGKER
jgi:hypothetical protein